MTKTYYKNIAKYFIWNPGIDRTWFTLSLFLFSLCWLPLAVGLLLAALFEVYQPGSYPVLRPTLIYILAPFMYILYGLDRTKVLLLLGASFMLAVSISLSVYSVLLLVFYDRTFSLVVIMLLSILSSYTSIIALSKSCHQNPKLVKYIFFVLLLVFSPIFTPYLYSFCKFL